MVKCNVITACKVGVGRFSPVLKKRNGLYGQKTWQVSFQSSFKWLLTNSGFGKFGDIKKELLTFYILLFSLTLPPFLKDKLPISWPGPKAKDRETMKRQQLLVFTPDSPLHTEPTVSPVQKYCLDLRTCWEIMNLEISNLS